MSTQRCTVFNALVSLNLIGLLTALPAQSMDVVPMNAGSMSLQQPADDPPAQEIEIDPNGLRRETQLAQEIEIDPNGLSNSAG